MAKTASRVADLAAVTKDLAIDLKCPICLELLNDPATPPCCHFFCWDCLHKAVKKDKLQCPVCKKGAHRRDISRSDLMCQILQRFTALLDALASAPAPAEGTIAGGAPAAQSRHTQPNSSCCRGAATGQDQLPAGQAPKEDRAQVEASGHPGPGHDAPPPPCLFPPCPIPQPHTVAGALGAAAAARGRSGTSDDGADVGTAAPAGVTNSPAGADGAARAGPAALPEDEAAPGRAQAAAGSVKVSVPARRRNRQPTKLGALAANLAASVGREAAEAGGQPLLTLRLDGCHRLTSAHGGMAEEADAAAQLAIGTSDARQSAGKGAGPAATPASRVAAHSPAKRSTGAARKRPARGGVGRKGPQQGHSTGQIDAAASPLPSPSPSPPARQRRRGSRAQQADPKPVLSEREQPQAGLLPLGGPGAVAALPATAAPGASNVMSPDGAGNGVVAGAATPGGEALGRSAVRRVVSPCVGHPAVVPPMRRVPQRLLPWGCPTCTLHNPATARKCGACKTARPPNAPRIQAPDTDPTPSSAPPLPPSSAREGGSKRRSSCSRDAAMPSPKRLEVGAPAKEDVATAGTDAAAATTSAAPSSRGPRKRDGRAAAGAGVETTPGTAPSPQALAPHPLTTTAAHANQGAATTATLTVPKQATTGGGWPGGTRQPWVMLPSGLGDADRASVKRLARLSGGTVVEEWEQSVTHVVCGVDSQRRARRTIKYLLGIAHGCWVLDVGWAHACVAAGEAVLAEPFEVLGDTSGTTGGPMAGRARVQAGSQAPALLDGMTLVLAGPFGSKADVMALACAVGATTSTRAPARAADGQASEPPRALALLDVECCQARGVSPQAAGAPAALAGLPLVSYKWLMDCVGSQTVAPIQPRLLQ